MRTRKLDERDRALIAEVQGYLRALHALWDDGDDNVERVLQSPAGYVLGLAGRVRALERKLWPIK